jgi:Putative zinc-finger
MNSPCSKIQLLLTEYSGGDLSSALVERVDAHLTICSSCRAELRREDQLRSLLSELPDQAYRGEAIGPKSTAGPGRRFLFVAGAAAVLLVAFLVRDFKVPTPVWRQNDQAVAEAVASDWTRAELDAAQNELAFSLALTARIIQKSEHDTVQKVFGEKIPRAISGSLNKAINTNQGDQG